MRAGTRNNFGRQQRYGTVLYRTVLDTCTGLSGASLSVAPYFTKFGINILLQDLEEQKRTSD